MTYFYLIFLFTFINFLIFFYNVFLSYFSDIFILIYYDVNLTDHQNQVELMDVDKCSDNEAVDNVTVNQDSPPPAKSSSSLVNDNLNAQSKPKQNRLNIVKHEEIEPQLDSHSNEKCQTSAACVVLEPHNQTQISESTIKTPIPSTSGGGSEKGGGRKEREKSKNATEKKDFDLTKQQFADEEKTLPVDSDVPLPTNLNSSDSDRDVSKLQPLEKKRKDQLVPSTPIGSDEDDALHDFDENMDSDSYSDIEGLISGMTKFNRHKWTPTPSRAVGKSGSWYEGDVDGKNMSGVGTLHSSDKREFIQGIWRDNILHKLHSCQFIDRGADQCTIYLRKQANSYLLTIDEDEFVARAKLRYSDRVDFSLNFRSIKIELFRNLIITKVVEDKLLTERESALRRFMKTLNGVLNDLSNPIDFATILITLRKYLRENSPKVILTKMMEHENMPTALRDAAKSLLIRENGMSNRRLELFKFSHDIQPPKLEVKTVIQTACSEAIKCHKKSLADKCPSSLPSLIANIGELPDDRVIYISKDDIEVFHHLASLTKEHHLLKFFNELHLGLFDKLRRIDSPPKAAIPLSSPVYGFLFKSFLEIITEIGLKAENCSVSTMFFQEQGKWKLTDEICWKEEVKQSNPTQLLQKSLNYQYRFIYKLLRHFDPRYFSVGKDFDYQFEILYKEDSDDSWLKKQFKNLKSSVMRSNYNIDIPQDRKVWLYILDHTIHNVVMESSSDSKSCLDLFRPMLDGFITFIIGSSNSSYESFRVVTHNVLMFVVQAIPHFQNTKKLSNKDLFISEKQMKYITDVSSAMKNDSLAATDFRNLIDEYKRYWSLRHLLTVDESLCPANFLSKIQEIHDSFLTLVRLSLDKFVNVSSLVTYFRELNDFIEDLKNIDFTSNWYVKSATVFRYVRVPGIIQKVDNKIASENSCSYKVIDLKRFVELFHYGCEPKHHIIDIVSRLLKCAMKCLSITWESSIDQSVAQMEATGALLSAMRRSFLYLKEQPDYRDFDLFSNESVQPFLQVVDRCHVLEEFKIRVNVVKESFWYIRKMDEIGIDQALKLFNSLNNGSLNLNKLKQCYESYVSKYDDYIREANPQSPLDGVNRLFESLTISAADFKEIGKWDEDIKTKKLPAILAIVSAVWSLFVSQDVSSSGKFLKPHCIQVLCIMRLLSMDGPSRGVEHHLAQVLTGQGKSVILGILSAVLALAGYKVRVLCYSDYLAERDMKDFKGYFHLLGITERISYGTFWDMADEFVNPVYQEERVSLRDLVNSIVLDHSSLKKLGTPSSNESRTVLLIDEVDVFFCEHFYGNTCNTCNSCVIPGMAVIQEKIWKTASSSELKRHAVYSLIESFIDEGVRSGNQDLKEYNKFRLKPGKIELLDDDNKGNLFKNEFSNWSLLEKHVMKMVTCAISVSRGTLRDRYINSFKIIDGEICCLRTEDGVYIPSAYYSYYNIFNYFRLKREDFDHKNYWNYGYILLNTGYISYAKLPEEFPLILGVSGTVSSLSEHENDAIKSYNINSFSILPTFFGDSNLTFNDVNNFCILDTEKDWLGKIFERINSVVEKHRAVLVFFNTDLILNSFQKEYGNRFDRLNVLTENTDESLKSKFVDEAGISNAVTLCTRGMGRGVDFKSSLAVEKKGGVHVIQTFFSLDVKEETQIKGRTARKDNKGSFELIISKEHLIGANLLGGTELLTVSNCNYFTLHQRRLHLNATAGAKIAERIAKSEKNHKLTMEFFGISASRE